MPSGMNREGLCRDLKICDAGSVSHCQQTLYDACEQKIGNIELDTRVHCQIQRCLYRILAHRMNSSSDDDDDDDDVIQTRRITTVLQQLFLRWHGHYTEVDSCLSNTSSMIWMTMVLYRRRVFAQTVPTELDRVANYIPATDDGWFALLRSCIGTESGDIKQLERLVNTMEVKFAFYVHQKLTECVDDDDDGDIQDSTWLRVVARACNTTYIVRRQLAFVAGHDRVYLDAAPHGSDDASRILKAIKFIRRKCTQTIRTEYALELFNEFVWQRIIDDGSILRVRAGLFALEEADRQQRRQRRYGDTDTGGNDDGDVHANKPARYFLQRGKQQVGLELTHGEISCQADKDRAIAVCEQLRLVTTHIAARGNIDATTLSAFSYNTLELFVLVTISTILWSSTTTKWHDKYLFLPMHIDDAINSIEACHMMLRYKTPADMLRACRQAKLIDEPIILLLFSQQWHVYYNKTLHVCSTVLDAIFKWLSIIRQDFDGFFFNGTVRLPDSLLV